MSFIKRLFGNREGVAKEPEGSPEDVSTALGLLSKGDYRGALRYADACIPHASNLGLLWRVKGECHFNLGELEESVGCFEKAYTLGGPSSEEMLLWKSMAEFNLGRVAAAKATVARHIRDLPAGDDEQIAKARGILARYDSE